MAAQIHPRAPSAIRGTPIARGDRDADRRRLRLALLTAWTLLGGQLVALLSFSWVEYHRWSNTWDYSIRYQGWWGIAHGNLDPFSSVVDRFFFQDHFELINWPLAPLSRLWPHGLWPLWIQDLMVVGAEIGAVLVVVDALRRGQWSRRIPGWVAVGLVTVMLVANPWIYESIAFDFHYQSVGAACFALLACREMMGGSTRRLVLWSALCLACGDIAGTYLAAVGAGGMLAGHGQRRRGLALFCIGLSWVGLTVLVGGNHGSKFSGHYGYLAGLPAGASLGLAGFLEAVVTHPDRGLAHLWAQRVDLWAYVASAGLIGLFTPWAVLPVVVLLENGLSAGTGIAGTPYESFGAVLFLIPLSVLALGRLDRRLERLGSGVDLRAWRLRSTAWLAPVLTAARTRLRLAAPLLGALLAASAVVWGSVWIPQVPAQWIRVGAPTASALNRAERLIPSDAEVVASQGVIGRFADRRWLYKVSAGRTYRLHTENTYFVIVPRQGIEIASVQTSEGLIGELAGRLRGRLLLERSGVWLIDLRRSPGVTEVSVPRAVTSLPAWVARSATATPVVRGPETDWHVTKVSDTSGVLRLGITWDEVPGRYQLTTTMDNTAPVDLEVWDSTTQTQLSRQMVPAASGAASVQTTVSVTQERRPGLLRGRPVPVCPDRTTAP